MIVTVTESVFGQPEGISGPLIEELAGGLPEVVLALVLGLVRDRWGTGASTVTHAIENVVQGSLVLIAFL